MRRSLRPAVTATLAAGALLGSAPAAQAVCANENVEPSSANLAQMRVATLCLLNEQRMPRGLSALRENALLTRASQEYSQLMVELGFFAHVTPQGVDLLERLNAIGYVPRNAAWTIGENLAWGTGGMATPRRIMLSWMDSPGHRENILTADFREVGLGIALGAPHSRTSPGSATYTTDFGVRGADETAGGNVSASTTAPPASPPARPRRASRPSAKSCKALRRARERRRLSRTERKRLARCRKAAVRRASR